ncbi:hypothetical protein [Nocardia sp. NPDC059239]|uniref:hypothetical protein n=1 Tax=unclassified Nocardia TaxID=2637762 RepID=UPI00368ABE81
MFEDALRVNNEEAGRAHWAAVRRCARTADADLARTAEAVDRIVRDAMAGSGSAQHLPDQAPKAAHG